MNIWNFHVKEQIIDWTLKLLFSPIDSILTSFKKKLEKQKYLINKFPHTIYKMKKPLTFLLLFLIYTISCYSNFTGIEICARYQEYNHKLGNYSKKGVPSSFNFPGGRDKVQGVYSKKTNSLWIFGGTGYDGINGIQWEKIK